MTNKFLFQNRELLKEIIRSTKRMVTFESCSRKVQYKKLYIMKKVFFLPFVPKFPITVLVQISVKMP